MRLQASSSFFAFSVVLFCGGLSPLRADRVVLAPQGGTLAGPGFKAEFALSPYRQDENLSWLQFSSPVGIELELNRFELAGDNKKRYSFNLQYPLIPELGAAPAVSLGVRDLLGTGFEHDSLYLAVSKGIPLSDRQYRLVRELRLSAGLGTNRMDGLFVGVHTRLAAGLQLDAEWYRYRPNVAIGLPLVRNLQAKAYSLDGTIYYGLSFSLTR